MVLANFAPDTYEYYFTSSSVACPEYHGNSTNGTYDGHHRRLMGGGGACHADRFLLYAYPIWGHDVTLHFFANDIVMVFHFGLAMKVSLSRRPRPHLTLTLSVYHPPCS